jgi:hypothetical protein
LEDGTVGDRDHKTALYDQFARVVCWSKTRLRGLTWFSCGRLVFGVFVECPPRMLRRGILSVWTGNGITFGSSSGAGRPTPLPWWLRAVL